MSDKLAHLSDKQIKELIDRYYNNEKVSDLIKDYKLDLRPSQLVKSFPPEVLSIECDYCEVNLIRQRKSRGSWREEEGTCPNCGHSEYPFCSCKSCLEIEKFRKEIEQQKKQEVLNQILFYDEFNKIELGSLSFTEKVYLGALLREGISEDYNRINPLITFVNPLAPTVEFQNEIIKLLKTKKAIVIHPNTTPESIVVDDAETGSYSYYPHHVTWMLNVKKEDLNKVPLIDLVTNPAGLTSKDYEEALELWKIIALNEVIEYFDHSVNNILGVDYSIGDKTITVFNDLLRDYSVSQIYGIIYRSVNNALRFRVEKGATLKHAANTIIGNAQNYAERAKVNNWNLPKYKRIKECPESALSKFFFERILRIGYNGFNEVPNMAMLREE